MYPTAQEVFKGEHDIVADPKFIDIQLNVIKGNFRQSKRSAGIGSGTNDIPQPTDINGKKRSNKSRDRGAFEQ
jgi:hypothetical protein